MRTRHQTTGTPLSPGGNLTWKTGQIIAYSVTSIVVAGLFFQPELTLKVVWFGVVPILPASFLVNAGLWRALCPLAGANMIPSKERGSILTGKWMQWASVIGILLLVILVPLRRILLNQNGPALAITLVGIVLLAFVLGFYVQSKGGFCNSICPVLPVEKLYGQSPLVFVRNPRCVPCNLCTSKGCIDIDPPASIGHSMGASQPPGKWLATPFGLFAAAFPGFIFGYFQLVDSPLSAASETYKTVLMYAGVSLMIVAAFTLLFKIPTKLLTPILGAASVGMYYWFASTASFEAFGLSGGVVFRWAMLVFISIWLFKALKKSLETPSNGGKGRGNASPLLVKKIKPAAL